MRRSLVPTALEAVLPLTLVCALCAGCGAKRAPATSAALPAPAAAAPVTPAPGAGRTAAPRTGAAASAPAPLVGHLTRRSLEGYETWKTLRADDYTPDPAAVRAIASRWRGVRTLVILGTWCKDSKRDLPRFFKIADQGRLGLGRVTLIGVDRSKRDAEGLSAANRVERVPTFIFFRGRKEIGRIVEKPKTTLEADIAAIVAK